MSFTYILTIIILFNVHIHTRLMVNITPLSGRAVYILYPMDIYPDIIFNVPASRNFSVQIFYYT